MICGKELGKASSWDSISIRFDRCRDSAVIGIIKRLEKHEPVIAWRTRIYRCIILNAPGGGQAYTRRVYEMRENDITIQDDHTRCEPDVNIADARVFDMLLLLTQYLPPMLY